MNCIKRSTSRWHIVRAYIQGKWFSVTDISDHFQTIHVWIEWMVRPDHCFYVWNRRKFEKVEWATQLLTNCSGSIELNSSSMFTCDAELKFWSSRSFRVDAERSVWAHDTMHITNQEFSNSLITFTVSGIAIARYLISDHLRVYLSAIGKYIATCEWLVIFSLVMCIYSIAGSSCEN